MAQDLRQQLTDNAKRRAAVDVESKAAEQEERELIAEAWRAHLPPAEIAQLAGRSAAHVRKFRPHDVPPLRLGGNAAPKKRRRR